MKTIYLKRGQVLCKEGDPWAHMYLIKTGEYDKTRCLKYVKEGDGNIKFLNKHISEHYKDKNEQSSSLIKYKKCNVAIIGSLDICCLEEQYIQSPVYLTTIVCASIEGTVYEVNRDFFKKVKGEDAIRMLK